MATGSHCAWGINFKILNVLRGGGGGYFQISWSNTWRVIVINFMKVVQSTYECELKLNATLSVNS